jgi:hypothetical protein
VYLRSPRIVKRESVPPALPTSAALLPAQLLLELAEHHHQGPDAASEPLVCDDLTSPSPSSACTGLHAPLAEMGR